MAPSAVRVVKCHTVIALQTQCTVVHVVTDDTNMIKECMDNVLLSHGQVQRRSSENVVLVDHGCVRPRAAGLHGSGAACHDRYKSGVKKGRDWEGRVLGERRSAWGRWKER